MKAMRTSAVQGAVESSSSHSAVWPAEKAADTVFHAASLNSGKAWSGVAEVKSIASSLYLFRIAYKWLEYFKSNLF